jgi:enoyl-CoA hydratase/carnithine racemase
MELILTGNTISGEELQRFGLVSKAMPKGDVLLEALALARNIASKSAPVVQIARQSILNCMLLSFGTRKNSDTSQPNKPISILA